MKNVVIAVIALVLATVAFLLGRRSVKPEIVEIHRTDTVVVRDTVRETVLVPKIRYLTRVDTVLLLVPGDTVKVPVLVPISRKVYEGEDYRARRVRLPRVARYTRYFPKNADRNEHGRSAGRGSRKPKRWGIGVSVGYALTPQGMKPYIGLGVQYDLISW